MNPNKSQSNISALRFLILIAAVLISIGCYYADLVNLPVIAPWLDWLDAWIYHWFPAFRTVPANASMFVSAAAVGLTFFLVAIVLEAFLLPSSKVGRMENQMRGIQRKRRPRSVKIE